MSESCYNLPLLLHDRGEDMQLEKLSMATPEVRVCAPSTLSLLLQEKGKGCEVYIAGELCQQATTIEAPSKWYRLCQYCLIVSLYSTVCLCYLSSLIFDWKLFGAGCAFLFCSCTAPSAVVPWSMTGARSYCTVNSNSLFISMPIY